MPQVRASLSPERLAFVALLLGALARLAQWGSDRSYWLDEASIVLALRDTTLGTVLRPLHLDQGGPVVFLVVERGVAEFLGEAERAMRLPALVAGLVALLLAWLAARASLPAPAVPVAALLIASSAGVYYSGEVKQYSGDLAVAALLLWLALRARTGGRGGLAVLGVAGACAPWASHPALFVMAGIWLSLTAEAARSRDRPRLVLLAVTGVAWAASAAVVYAVNISRLDDVGGLATGPNSYLVPSGPLDVAWAQHVLATLDETLGLPPQTVGFGALVLVLGVVAVARRHGGTVAGIVTAPAALALGAGYAGAYPAGERFYVFLIPTMAILVAAGTWWSARSAWTRAPVVAVALLAVLVVPAAGRLLVLTAAPRERQEIEPVLAQLRERLRPGDTVYVTHRTSHAFSIYAPGSQLPGARVVREAPRTSLAQAARALEAAPGRVWLLVTHETTRGGLRDRAALRFVLDRGRVRTQALAATGATADLYEPDAGRP